MAGCKTTPITTPPVEVAFTSQETRTSVQKFVNLESRTFAYNDNGRREEIEDIGCRIEGNGFRVSYSTPANVRLPVFGLNTSDLSMFCTYEGEQKFKTIRVRNLTQENISSAGSGGGLVGAVVASGIAAARGNRPNDNYSYTTPHMDVNSRPQRRTNRD